MMEPNNSDKNRLSLHWLTPLWLLVFVFLIGCSTGQQAFERGDFGLAVTQASNRLKNAPANEKALAALRQAYPEAKRKALAQIQQASASGDAFKWEKVASQYEHLNKLSQAIRSTPAAEAAIPDSTIYVNELNSARKKGSDERRNAGNRALSGGTRESARTAYAHFSVANRLSPGTADITRKMALAKDRATLRVVINPVGCAPPNINVACYETKMTAFLNDYRPSNFVRFFTANQARAAGITIPDQVIDMHFTKLGMGRVDIDTKCVEQSLDIVTGKTETTPPKDIVSNVKATVTVYHKTARADTTLNFKISDPTGAVYQNKQLCSHYDWCHEWASFSGDKRAISKPYLKLLDCRNIPVPCHQEMFEQMVGDIFDQSCEVIRQHFKQYR